MPISQKEVESAAMAETNAKADLGMQGGFGGHGHGHVHFPNKVGQVEELTLRVAVGVMMMSEICYRALPPFSMPRCQGNT